MCRQSCWSCMGCAEEFSPTSLLILSSVFSLQLSRPRPRQNPKPWKLKRQSWKVSTVTRRRRSGRPLPSEGRKHCGYGGSPSIPGRARQGGTSKSAQEMLSVAHQALVARQNTYDLSTHVLKIDFLMAYSIFPQSVPQCLPLKIVDQFLHCPSQLQSILTVLFIFKKIFLKKSKTFTHRKYHRNNWVQCL